ncbi:Trp biosynthesis-associated membrane protein [Plantactinospora sonchi]|uniref:Trp biosynthesis-associated membrane protein n=1 Tax=Plantactinospora sonchi TaxID=1544735 RepID=A0ABU7RW31_9ACTN
MTYAVLLCLLGAGLAVFASTRTWAVELTARPAPLPAIRTVRTGGDLLPWLPALALVGLAAAGAVLATRGLGRRLVGVLLTLVGAGLLAGGVYGGFGLAPGGISVGWPVLCALGGLLTAAAGVVTAVRGAGWPVMGARYERSRPGGGPAKADRTPETADRVEGRRTTAAWDALDRGEDPTVS